LARAFLCFQLLDQAEKHFTQKLGCDAFRKWTLLYEPVVLALSSAFFPPFQAGKADLRIS
jgi:hypothetical protein